MTAGVCLASPGGGNWKLTVPYCYPGYFFTMCHKPRLTNDPKDEIFATLLTKKVHRMNKVRTFHRYAASITTDLVQHQVTDTLDSINRLFRAILSILVVPIKRLNCKKHPFLFQQYILRNKANKCLREKLS